MDSLVSNSQIYLHELNKNVVILNMGGREESALSHELMKADFKVQVITDISRLKLLLKMSDVSTIIIDNIINKSALFGFAPSLRQEYEIPLIVIFEESNVDDRVQAIDLGADACFGKLVDSRELIAMIRGLLRRTGFLKNRSLSLNYERIKRNYPILFGDHSFDPQTQILLHAERAPKKLTYSETRILKILIFNRGNPISRELLYEYIQKNGKNMIAPARKIDVFGRRIDVHIASIRKKLNDTDHGIIKTIRNSGYEFIAEMSDY